MDDDCGRQVAPVTRARVAFGFPRTIWQGKEKTMFRTKMCWLAGLVCLIGGPARAESVTEIAAALNLNDGRVVSAAVPSYTYEFFWDEATGEFVVSRDSVLATDAVTINDTAPITFSAFQRANGLPEISGTASLTDLGELKIVFKLRPGGNTDYEGTVTIGLSACPCEQTISFLVTDWGLDKVCECHMYSWMPCSHLQCDLGVTCYSYRTCRWLDKHAITVP
jgi:hypothetical protein